MRKMKRHRLAGIILSILICLTDFTLAQENFEDADKLSDLMSGSTGQQFDLRHTIPGIPEVDYPIYSEVPKTSFECEGRHEGYYADIESRCQAFRICTHTARSSSGFGFLCPNGTLFSQKYFVCDWYRNVNCDDSERYFNKNDANRIGSSLDMMETVRQMMEYPMKTISKALQQNPGSSRKPTQRHRGNNSRTQQKTINKASDTVERSQTRSNSARKSVTRAQVESAQNRGTKKYHTSSTSVSNESSNTASSGSSDKSISAEDLSTHTVESSNVEEDVYVNSLGELSTDPGVNFDRTNAHIIAEPRRYRYEKNKNFAAKVNAALTDSADMPAGEKLAPDYVKQMRSSNTQTESESTQIDLASNINGLLDEVANDLNPNTSGYQVQAPSIAKHTFKFLSRGFSSQNDPYKYKKPKQTASTIRFTPNQLPSDDEKPDKKPTFEIADDATGFGQASPITTTTETPLRTGALDYLVPPSESPKLEYISYLEPPLLPPVDGDDNTTNSTDEPNEVENIITTTPETEVYTVTPSAVDLPVYAALAETTTLPPTTESQSIVETTTVLSDIAQNLVLSLQPPNQEFNENDDTAIDEDRVDAHKQAEKLFFSGLKLTANENETESSTFKADTPLLIQVPEDHSYLTAWITSTSAPTTVSDAFATTTTEAPAIAAESGSFQDRIRNYRRLASLQRATVKPVIFGKRGHLRMSTKLTTTASTTAKPTRTTRSYLKRVAASRLRLSRLAAAANNRNNNNLNSINLPSLSPVDNAVDGVDKKLAVRNIDKETAAVGNGLNDANAAKTPGIVTLESVRNSLQRFQVGHKKSNDDIVAQQTTTTTSSTPANDEVTTTPRSSLMRNRTRFSNFKMPPSLRNRESNNSISKATVTEVSQTHSSSSLPLSFLNALTSKPQISNNAASAVVSNSAFLADKTNLNSNSASSTDSPNYISFDELTRSIVDDSILQNYRAGQTLGRTAVNPVTATSGFQGHTSTSSAETYSAAASNLNAYQVSSRNAYNNQIFATPARQSFSKITVPAPPQLAPPQRPAHLPVYQAQTSAPLTPTTPGPRIVIARAEGQRLEPNSVSSIISSLITQQQQKSPPKPTPATSYVPLDSFLTKKFGNQPPTKATQIAATYYQQPPLTQQRQQQTQPSMVQQYQQQTAQQQQQRQQPTQTSIAQQYQPQTAQQQQEAQQNQYRQQSIYQNTITSLQPPQPTLPTIYSPLGQQQSQQQQQAQQSHFNQSPQLAPATQSLQTFSTQNIFSTYLKQQQQLPQFPPLGTQAPSVQPSSPSLAFQKLSPQFNGGSNFLNIQLPSLNNGLIPAPTLQTAQKRSDANFDNLELTASTPVHSVYRGATSYDVPLNSVGRLPNDITALLRRLRRY